MSKRSQTVSRAHVAGNVTLKSRKKEEQKFTVSAKYFDARVARAEGVPISHSDFSHELQYTRNTALPS